MQSALNLKIKFRESFRPFAPCVLREHVHEWFEMRPGEESPYMLLVAPVLENRRLPLSREDQETLRSDPDLARRVNVARSTVPAITHVDYSARVQTVDERHGRYYRLMKKFHELTDCPVIVNTSFNLSWEPIVLTPREAYHTFMQSAMDVLVLEDFVLYKSEQPLGVSPWATAGEVAGPVVTVPTSAHVVEVEPVVVDARPRAIRVHTSSPWADPTTGEPLVVTPERAFNAVTGASFPVEEGIPRLFVPTNRAEENGRDVTELVKQFYEKTPFPNYEDLDNLRGAPREGARGVIRAASQRADPVRGARRRDRVRNWSADELPVDRASDGDRYGHLPQLSAAGSEVQDGAWSRTRHLCADEPLPSGPPGRLLRRRHLQRGTASHRRLPAGVPAHHPACQAGRLRHRGVI